MLNGVKAGETDIVVTAKNNDKVYARCHVKVGLAVTGVELSSKNATLNIGKTLKLKANVLPSNATDKSLVWSSDDESVATVDSNGLVTAKGKGFANITAMSKQNSNAKGICKIEVLRIRRN